MFESPLSVLVIGLFVEALLAVAFVNTRRGELLIAMAGVLLAVLVGVGIERLVVTEREQVEAALYGAAGALEQDDYQGVLSYVSPSAETMRARVNSEWHLYRVTVVKFRNLEIKINRLTTPPTAEAKFDAVVRGMVRGGITPESTYPLDVTVGLRKEGDRWLVGNEFEYHLQRL